jgi:hypothetical protein
MHSLSAPCKNPQKMGLYAKQPSSPGGRFLATSRKDLAHGWVHGRIIAEHTAAVCQAARRSK